MTCPFCHNAANDHNGVGSSRDAAGVWSRCNLTRDQVEYVARLRAIIASHAQAGCQCRFCQDAKTIQGDER